MARRKGEKRKRPLPDQPRYSHRSIVTVPNPPPPINMGSYTRPKMTIMNTSNGREWGGPLGGEREFEEAKRQQNAAKEQWIKEYGVTNNESGVAGGVITPALLNDRYVTVRGRSRDNPDLRQVYSSLVPELRNIVDETLSIPHLNNTRQIPSLRSLAMLEAQADPETMGDLIADPIISNLPQKYLKQRNVAQLVQGYNFNTERELALRGDVLDVDEHGIPAHGLDLNPERPPRISRPRPLPENITDVLHPAMNRRYKQNYYV